MLLKRNVWKAELVAMNPLILCFIFFVDGPWVAGIFMNLFAVFQVCLVCKIIWKAIVVFSCSNTFRINDHNEMLAFIRCVAQVYSYICVVWNGETILPSVWKANEKFIIRAVKELPLTESCLFFIWFSLTLKWLLKWMFAHVCEKKRDTTFWQIKNKQTKKTKKKREH
jgi:hypothetical protein